MTTKTTKLHVYYRKAPSSPLGWAGDIVSDFIVDAPTDELFSRFNNYVSLAYALKYANDNFITPNGCVACVSIMQ